MSTATHTRHRPYFFWDYDISEEQVRDLVRNGSPTEKAWVVGRILEHATWSDIWRYLTVADIRDSLPHIRFRHPQDRDHCFGFGSFSISPTQCRRWHSPNSRSSLSLWQTAC